MLKGLEVTKEFEGMKSKKHEDKRKKQLETIEKAIDEQVDKQKEDFKKSDSQQYNPIKVELPYIDVQLETEVITTLRENGWECVEQSNIIVPIKEQP